MAQQKTILDEEVFPIMGYAGPSGDMINRQVMSDMAAAGFTVSHSDAGEDMDDVMRALDVAAEAGVRLVLRQPAWDRLRRRSKDGVSLPDGWQRDIEQVVPRVQEHPGLYGYFLCDEPWFCHLDVIAQIMQFVRSIDSYHICYVNHHPPIYGFGAPTVDEFWRYFTEKAQPRFLSYDHYPIQVAMQEEIEARRDEPNVFPEEHIIVKPDYFECLELARTFSVRLGIPFWAFTNAVRHAAYPKPTEGHIRWQLMNDLAYGAKGLEYFTYSHDQAMVRPDGSLTETWEIARRVNEEIHYLAPVLRTLRSIGVFRTGPVWSGTRALHDTADHIRMSENMVPRVSRLAVNCEGDPVTIGLFLNPEGQLHIFVVNGSHCSPSRIVLRVNHEEDEELFLIDPVRRRTGGLYPTFPRWQMVALEPGEGRLFRVGGEGEKANF